MRRRRVERFALPLAMPQNRITTSSTTLALSMQLFRSAMTSKRGRAFLLIASYLVGHTVLLIAVIVIETLSRSSRIRLRLRQSHPNLLNFYCLVTDCGVLTYTSAHMPLTHAYHSADHLSCQAMPSDEAIHFFQLRSAVKIGRSLWSSNRQIAAFQARPNMSLWSARRSERVEDS